MKGKRRTDIVYFDVSIAFDEVPAEKLVVKMEAVGNHPMAWIGDSAILIQKNI